MSLPEENRMLPPTEAQEEESTIFSAPVKHNDRTPKKKPLWTKLLAAFLALAIVAGGTAAVIKLIPEKQGGSTNETPTIEVLNIDSANIERIDVKNTAGSFTLLSEVTETNSASTVSWYVDGIEKTFVDSSTIESTVTSSISMLSAFKTVEGSEADFGLDNPQAEIILHPKNSAFELVTIKIGNEAPSGLGYYCKLSNKDTIYLADSSVASLPTVVPLVFATTVGVSGVIPTEANSSHFADGLISDFDYISLSGSRYPNPVRIEVQKDETINSYFAFKVTSPTVRIGNEDKITELVQLMSSGITSAGAYSFDTTEESLQKYGLYNPDVVFTISVAGKTYTIIASKIDDSFCAVVDTYGGIIHKIPTSSLPFVTASVTDYYSSFIVLENLSGLSNFKAEFADGTVYDFVTEYNSEDESYKAFIGGKELDITNFKALYSEFIGLSPVEYDSKDINETALTITLVHSDGSSDTVLKFKQYSSGRYQVEMNGIPMGLITATNYDKFTLNIKNAATNTPVA